MSQHNNSFIVGGSDRMSPKISLISVPWPGMDSVCLIKKILPTSVSVNTNTHLPTCCDCITYIFTTFRFETFKRTL